jgi:hypothetical protein
MRGGGRGRGEVGSNLTYTDILDGTAEQDDVLLKDPHPTDGFVLLPDFKWNRVDLSTLYCLGTLFPSLPSFILSSYPTSPFPRPSLRLPSYSSILLFVFMSVRSLITIHFISTARFYLKLTLPLCFVCSSLTFAPSFSSHCISLVF